MNQLLFVRHHSSIALRSMRGYNPKLREASVGWAKGVLAHHLCQPQPIFFAITVAHRGGQKIKRFAHPTKL